MHKAYDNYIISAIEELPATQEEFLQLKKRLSKLYKLPLPTNADLRDRYNTLVKEKKVIASKAFEAILLSRAIRTQSGVAVVAVLTKSYPCPGKCIYCPTEKDMPKSYLSNEPAVMRAIDSHFDPYLQVQNRLRSLEINGHKTDKIELIVMGGTFSFLPKDYQKKFIVRCFQACNEYSKKSLVTRHSSLVKNLIEEKLIREQKKNETAKHRIIGLTLETRPDYIDENEIINFRNLGCTRVELGVQSIYDDVLKLNKRGHLIDETIRATKLLKDAGFKINFHMMPGLPGSTPSKDFKMFKQLFTNQDFQPDMLKIYPTVVLKDSILYNMWKKGHYKPLNNKTFEKLVLKIKNEAPTSSIIAGPTISNLRQIIIPQSKCPCIRCREVREGYPPRLAKAIARRREAGEVENEIILDRIDYPASDGKEIFLQYVSPDKKKLFALLRLRISNDSSSHFIPALRNAALIREVHTYGKLTQIDKKNSNSPQHIGLGKKLLIEAERITKEEFGLGKIVVISGVGVRGYYRKSGYRLRETYMVKNI
ncbi:MAG: Histone acetyltransferase, ELP3 family [Candidatus Moranbacteria bacterium GW2011_GWC2_37_8]|nr:MAG: Histone acetyltransferase, ELP3 family [Candidatus Moranbacteria bacterium GW2011_GWC2_37_8]